jgi:hypothetical protein
MTGGWRKLHSDGVHKLNLSFSINGLMKLRRTSEARHVACMGKKSNQDFCGEAWKKRDH